MRAFFLAIAFFLVGLAGGAAFDAAPERADVQRGPWLVLAFDLHTHTRFSDGLMSPLDVVMHARRRGLDGIALTEHNMLFPAKIARAWSRRIYGPMVIPGEEVTTGRWHLLALGIEKPVSSRHGLARAIEDIHAQRGVAIAAHPVAQFQPVLRPELARLDGAEVMHPIAWWTGGSSWSWESMRAFFAEARRDNPRFTAIGTSDYHGFSPLGLVRTLVFVERRDEASVMDALRAGRTVVYDRTGRAYGDPAMIALLDREPYPVREEIAGYAARSLFDALSRVLGLIGALGILLLRPPRPAVDLLSSPASSVETRTT